MRKPRTFAWDGTLVLLVTTEDGERHEVEIEFAGIYKPAIYDGHPENWVEAEYDYTFTFNDNRLNDEVKYLAEEIIKSNWVNWVMNKGRY